MQLVTVITLLFTTVFGAGVALPPADLFIAPRQSLDEGVADLLRMMPSNQMLGMCVTAFTFDKSVQNAVRFLKSAEFSAMIRDLRSKQEYFDLVDYLSRADFELHNYFTGINGILNHAFPKTVQPGQELVNITFTPGNGVDGLMRSLIGVVPLYNVKSTYNYKLSHDNQFRSNVEKLREPHFHKLLGQMKSLVDYKKTVDKLKKLGVEVDDYIALLIEYFELAP